MLPAEIALARRFSERRSLTPPVDVEALVRQYADLEYVNFPIDIDGLCLNLKVQGKKTEVLVDRSAPLVRQRFTLAHELGHILIPWHIGNVVDEIDAKNGDNGNYIERENEANRFASELLLPQLWTLENIDDGRNILESIFWLAETAWVSIQATVIKVVNCIGPGYVLACAHNGSLVWSYRSPGTIAGSIPRKFNFESGNPFPFECDRWFTRKNERDYYAWKFVPVQVGAPETLRRSWREILDEISNEIIVNDSEKKKFKSSVSAVTSYANGSVRENRSVEKILSAILQRMHTIAKSDTSMKCLVEHEKFTDFCQARADSFIKH